MSNENSEEKRSISTNQWDLPATQPELESGIVIFDEENERSVINLMPPAFKTAMKLIDSKWMTWKLKTLEGKLGDDIDFRDRRYKMAFWVEYDRCQQNIEDFSMTRVVQAAGIPWKYYEQKICSNPKLVAWILHPPSDYELTLREILNTGMDRLREILDLEVVDPSGKVNTALIKLKMAIVQNAEHRLMGAVKQMLEVKQQNLNLNVDTRREMFGQLPNTVDDIDKELKRLSVETTAKELQKKTKE